LFSRYDVHLAARPINVGGGGGSELCWRNGCGAQAYDSVRSRWSVVTENKHEDAMMVHDGGVVWIVGRREIDSAGSA